MKHIDIMNKKSVLSEKELNALIDMGLMLQYKDDNYVSFTYKNACFSVYFAMKMINSKLVKDEDTHTIAINIEIDGDPYEEKEGVLPVIIIRNAIKKLENANVIKEWM